MLSEVKQVNGKRRNDKICMSITEQLESVKEYCCDTLCKYREAFEIGSKAYPDKATTGKENLEELYCKNCMIKEI